MAKNSYPRQSHLNAVSTASQATYSARVVLEIMCRLSSWSAPESSVSKSQLMTEARITRKTVQRALQFLREEGTLVPIRNFAGGYGRATTYRLCIAGQGGRKVAQAPEGEGIGPELVAWIEQYAPKHAGPWVAGVTVEGPADGILTVLCPSAFHAEYLRTQAADAWEVAAQFVCGDQVQRIEFEARG